MQPKLESLLLLLLSGLTSASPSAASIFRRDCTQPPTCTGCGIGLSQSDYQNLVNQINPNDDYAIPWDSTMNNLSGVTTNADGTPAMGAWLIDTSDYCNPLSTKSDIDGQVLQSSLQALTNTANENQEACISLNGELGFGLGSGSNCAGDGGP